MRCDHYAGDALWKGADLLLDIAVLYEQVCMTKDILYIEYSKVLITYLFCVFINII